MKNDQVEKKILEVDGNDLEGLVNLGEYGPEDDTVNVPGLNKTVPVRNGVAKIPEIDATFKIRRNSRTLKFLQDWYNKKEVKDVIVKRVDGAGNEFARDILPNTELKFVKAPAYDASTPAFAQATTMLLPEDIIPVDPQ